MNVRLLSRLKQKKSFEKVDNSWLSCYILRALEGSAAWWQFFLIPTNVRIKYKSTNIRINSHICGFLFDLALLRKDAIKVNYLTLKKANIRTFVYL